MKKKVLLLIPALLIGIMITGCTSPSQSTANKEQKLTEANQEKLLKVQPPVKLDWSLEREQINNRTKLWNDTNKISYIYLVSYGKVMAFYTVKGKVSSVNSQITNPQQIIGTCNDGKPDTSCASIPLPSPAEDGSYGTNGYGIFFFTTDGIYVEWAGEYMLADQPLQLSTPPELVREIK